MKYLGAHVSIAGGVENAPLRAQEIGANAFALFTKNQRQWKSKELTEDNIFLFKERCKNLNIKSENIVPHVSYLMNLCNSGEEAGKKSNDLFLIETQRVFQLGLNKLNFHCGSHLNKISVSNALKMVSDSINEMILKVEKVSFVIENCAGQGSNVGSTFEEIAEIIQGVKDKSRVGVCLDTCHLFAAGYDIKDDYENVFDHFGKTIGFHYLQAMHINDSKKPLGSKVDRHETLGNGYIGAKAFEKIIKDERLDGLPLILETPNPDIWKDEIVQLSSYFD